MAAQSASGLDVRTAVEGTASCMIDIVGFHCRLSFSLPYPPSYPIHSFVSFSSRISTLIPTHQCPYLHLASSILLHRSLFWILPSQNDIHGNYDYRIAYIIPHITHCDT